LVDPATGKVRLELTKLPDGLSGRCNLSLVLDPLKACPDVDRENNILNFVIFVNGSSNGSSSSSGSCKVFPDFASGGEFVIRSS